MSTSAQTKTDQSKNDKIQRPLVVDVIGTIAVRWSETSFELWMPDLTGKKNRHGEEIRPHQAGISTKVTGFELGKGDYQIVGTESSPELPAEPYPTGKAKIYQCHASDTSAPNRYIHMLLPVPHCIVVLDPVPAKIYQKKSDQPDKASSYASGVRLLYGHSGTPSLKDLKDPGSLREIELDPAPCEKQSNMLVRYTPYDTRDIDHADSQAEFREVSLLFSLDLQVDFDPVHHFGPFIPCASPVLRLV